MAGIPPQSRSSSGSGSITCPVHPIACPSLAWPQPRPCSPANADPRQGAILPLRQLPQCSAAGGRAPVRLTGEPARSSQGFGGFGLSRRDREAAARPQAQPSKRESETMNKKSIAPPVSGVYVRPASRQVDDEAILLRSRRFAWQSSVPKLHVIK